MTYIAIVAVSDNRVAKYKAFDVVADANDHVSTYGGFVYNNTANDPIEHLHIVDEVVTISVPPVESRSIDRERDRRINGGFIYSNNNFQTTEDARANISGAQGLSLGAMIVDPTGTAGLRWANPDVDFTWTTTDNTEFPMTAAICQDFCVKAMSYKTAIIKTARVLKDMDPPPTDYSNNAYWPSKTLN